MSDLLALAESYSESGRAAARHHWDRGWRHGCADAIVALLRARFDDADDRDDLDQLAWKLTGYDYEGNIAAILRSAAIADLWILVCSQLALAPPIVIQVGKPAGSTDSGSSDAAP